MEELGKVISEKEKVIKIYLLTILQKMTMI